MSNPNKYLKSPPDLIEPGLAKLVDLFVRMEKAYTAAADAYGFKCIGCEDNCCLTRFYHHTLLEYLYLYRGYARLPAKSRDQLQQEAARVIQEQVDEPDLRSMCPLNENGLCGLYAYRPMICRLHGIPNEMRRPGGVPVRGPGCGDFDRQCGGKPYIIFDRTPLYMEMASSEKELRDRLGATQKIKMTVAEMIVSFLETGVKN